MSKEIYLITAHPEDPVQKRYLRNLVTKLKSAGKKIMVSSHVPIQGDIHDMVDYYFFNRKNDLLTDGKYKGYLSMNYDSFSVESKNFFTYNSTLACYQIVFPAMLICKSEGFDVIHLIEYDTEIEDFSEFDENAITVTNSDLDFIIYNKHYDPDGFFMSGEYLCVNTRNLPLEYFSYDEDFLKAEIENHKMGEGTTFNFFIKDKKYLVKKRSDVIGFKLGLHHTDNSDDGKILAPLIMEDNSVSVFFNNRSKSAKKIIAVIDGSRCITKNTVPGQWHIFPVGNLGEFGELALYVEDKLNNRYFFNTQEEIEKIREENHIIFRN
jgi:hypothetical protein